MKCPHCNQEIPGKECPSCETVIPFDSIFCMNCGHEMTTDTGESDDNLGSFDLEDRILCSDGTCTGIIINGKCIECGQPPS